MKTSLFITAALAAAAVSSAAASVPLTINSSPKEGSALTIIEEADGSVTATMPYSAGETRIVFNPLEETLPEDLRVFTFEYQCSKDYPQLRFQMFKCGKYGRTSKYEDLPFGLTATEDGQWHTYTLYVGRYRDSGAILLGKKDQYQGLWMLGMAQDDQIRFRNFRYVTDEAPFRPLVLRKDADNVIEAEDYNYSLSGTQPTHTSRRPFDNPQPAYVNPVAPHMPVMAWIGPNYVSYEDGNGGYDWARSNEAFHQRYVDMVDCGFNLTFGIGFNFDKCFLFDGQAVNGVKVNLHDGAEGLKMMLWNYIKTEEGMAYVPWFSESDRLGGYNIGDEPFVMYYPGHENLPDMAARAAAIREIDQNPEHVMYGNLYGVGNDMSIIGAKDYDEYVNAYVRMCNAPMMSYDMYPVRQVEATGEIILIPNFFENLEILARMTRYYDIPFWGFVHSTGSPCAAEGYTYPAPEENHMRVQAFTNLAYGAQGIEYFTYSIPEPDYHDAPLNEVGEKTPVWDMVKRVNTDIHALEPVFVGCRLECVGHTNAVTPQGCLRLTAAMLPQGVTEVKHGNGDNGLLVSRFRNGAKEFLMVLNCDLHNNQTATLTLSQAMQQVAIDGSLAPITSGEQSFTLEPGHFLLLQVRDDLPEAEELGPADTDLAWNTEYRTDENVAIAADAQASNGLYVADMGDPQWDNFFTNAYADDGQRTITEEAAQQNWGATFRYTFTTEEDMDLNIWVSRSVPRDAYEEVKAEGLEPGYRYTMAGNPSLNYPREYAASMRLLLDGEAVTPANGAADNVLHFAPAGEASAATPVPACGETPDFRNVHFAAGEHTLTVQSMCYPWHFDALVLSAKEESGIEDVAAETAKALRANGEQGGISVESAEPFRIFDAQGRLSAKGEGCAHVTLPQGLYIVANGQSAKKVIVK